MFRVCSRGSASITRAFRALPTARTPSIFPLSFHVSEKPALEARWLHVSQLRRQVASAQYNNKESDRPHSIKKFDELVEQRLVHPNVVKTITEGMGHENMTQVQRLTINEALNGTDIIAQARTGTGKTIGFLLPLIQNILKKSPDLANPQRYSRARPSDIRAIIISPTRELAEQIAVEASKLCVKTDLKVQVATGGNSKTSMLRKTQREGCHILVATPGRLNDLLTDPYSGISAPGLTTLVLDEADRLLDDGFARDIEAIIDLLPNRQQVDRQTLLFSATVPKEVMHLVRNTLKPDFQFVQTVQEGDVPTHEKVPQKVVSPSGMENLMPALLELAKREIGRAGSHFKAIVYFNSTASVVLAHQIFENLKSDGGLFGRHPLMPAELLVMNGQMSQERRTRSSNRFRSAKSAILFSTDVTARGMDFPNVTHVIQIGLPSNREQYIHRIGRTGRGDKTGEAYIFVHEIELPEVRRLLKGLPITPDQTLEAAKVDMTSEAQLPSELATTLTQIGDATKMVDRATKTAAYFGLLAPAQKLGPEYIEILNRWTRYGWGWEQPPFVSYGLAQRLGISRFPGIVIGTSSRDSSDPNRESRYGGSPRRDYDDSPRRVYGGSPGRDFGDSPRRDYGDSPRRVYSASPARDYGNSTFSDRGFGDRGLGDRETGDKESSGRRDFRGRYANSWKYGRDAVRRAEHQQKTRRDRLEGSPSF